MRSAALLLLLLVPGAHAFGSVPPSDSAHDHVTAVAARSAGFPDGAIAALQEAVRRPDLREMKVAGVGKDLVLLDAGADYEPAHHCDRVPPATDGEAFAATQAFVALERGQALRMARGHHPERAVWLLGYALHALQDCFSHSSVTDTDAATQAAFMAALLHGGPLPDGILLAAVQPGAEEMELPPGDPYPHGRFNKDVADRTPDAAAVLPDGRTKFEAAQQLATAASAAVLGSFVANLTAAQREGVFGVSPTTSPQHLLPVGSPVALPVLLALALVASRRGRGGLRGPGPPDPGAALPPSP